MTTPYKGNAFLLKISTTWNGTTTWTTVGALKSTSLERSTSVVDITNKDGNGWTENMVGVKSSSISASGIATGEAGQELLETAFAAQTPWNCQIINTAGDTWAGPYIIESLNFSGEHNVEQTFEVTLTSAGEIEYTPFV